MNAGLESKIGRNPVVMQKVAEQLPAKNLFMLRLTCKMWNQKFIPQLRIKHSPVKIVQWGWGCDENSANWVNQRLERYTQTVQIGQDLPYTKYIINLVAENEHTRNLPKFLTKFGGTITHLVLQWTSSNQFTPSELRSIVFERAPFLVSLKLVASGLEDPEEETPNSSFAQPIPNLKKINGYLCNRDSTTLIRLLAEMIVQQAPHLESLNLRDDFGCGLPVLSEIKNSVADLHKLKTLKLGKTSVTWLKLLVELGGRSKNGLKLEKFSTTIQYNNWSGVEEDEEDANGFKLLDIHEASQLLYKFLVTQSGTLRKLEIGLDETKRDILAGYRPDVPFNFPRLEHVHKFQLNINRATLAYDENLFADTFPKLRHFVFCCPDYRTNLEDDDDVSRLFHVGVTELHLYLSCPEQLVPWPKLFPSVTHLFLWRELGLEVVDENTNCWTLWPKLVELNNKNRVSTMEDSRVCLNCSNKLLV